MRNAVALAKRILQQFAHDPRTIVMFIVGPILILWLFSVLLNTGDYQPKLATVELPSKLNEALSEEGADCTSYKTADEANELLQQGKIDAVLTLKDETLTIQVEGSNPSKTGSVVQTVQSAVKTYAAYQRETIQSDLEARFSDIKTKLEGFKTDVTDFFASLPPVTAIGDALSMLPGVNTPKPQPEFPSIELPDIETIILGPHGPVSDVSVTYLHGDESWGTFDFFGPVFIGIFIFIFVFITSGMSLVTERMGGTMERLLVTPIKPWELVLGFCLGFGLVTIVQASLVLWACVTLIGFPNEGSLALVAFIAFSMALVSLTLGLVVSAVAKTPFQVIQFMLILVIPQVLLSGVFDLSQAPTWMKMLSVCFPITHGADALRDVMLRGAGFADIALNLTILWGFIVALFVLATSSFQRRKTS
ncbi:MAG: ABC transporter permease [Coriobacteriia bacterium]|nr:ABC transporter permease [Coriobacteriia bacterium]